MKKKGDKKMKKNISLFMAMLLIMFLAGCGNSGGEPANNKDGNSKLSATPTEFTAQQSYAAYMEAKSELTDALTDALSDNPDYAMESMALLGVVLVDVAIMPAAFLGLGQDAVANGLAVLGGTDVKYTENGNLYTVTYKNQNGETYEFQAKYDPAADVLVCEVISGGEDEGIYYEYRKAPFGYVGQIYSFERDAVAESYRISMYENGGVIGIFESDQRPAALTGGEAKDFPKACPRWYAQDGSTITAVTAEGEEVSFEYSAKEE